jgi:hypothetical protein
MRLAVVIAMFGVIAGGYYLARRGFGREWRYRVVEELHKRGVEADIGRLTLDPFRGLVARNVRIFDYKIAKTRLPVSARSRWISITRLFIVSRFSTLWM